MSVSVSLLFLVTFDILLIDSCPLHSGKISNLRWTTYSLCKPYKPPALRMKTCEVLDLTKRGKVVYSLSLALALLKVQFVKSTSFKWKRDWGEHSLHFFMKWFHWVENYRDGSVMVKLTYNGCWHCMESSRYTNAG